MKHDVVYLVYVYIPDEVYKKIEGLNYIYNHFEFDSKTRIWSGLYGWTYKTGSWIFIMIRCLKQLQFMKMMNHL